MYFDHIKTIIAIILGLSVTTLLKGIIKFVQHPKLYKPYRVHLAWCMYVLLLIIHLWWWESGLKTIPSWNFAMYFFLFLYIATYYFLCSLLIPENLEEYNNYYNYFYSRKKWIFGVLATTFALDFVDTFIKGQLYYKQHFNWEYPVRNILHILLCIIAMNTNNKKFHVILVTLFIVYEVSFIYRLFFNFQVP